MQGNSPPKPFSLKALQDDVMKHAKITRETGYRMKNYLRVLPSVFDKGKLQYEFGNHEAAYALLFRFVLLVVQNLKKHTEYKNFQGTPEFSKLKKLAAEAMPMVEESQQYLEQREEKEQNTLEEWKKEQAERERQQKEEEERRQQQELDDERRRAEAARMQQLEEPKTVGEEGGFEEPNPMFPTAGYSEPIPSYALPAVNPSSGLYDMIGSQSPVLVSDNIVPMFEAIAADNTHKGIETMGILGARMTQSATGVMYHVTGLFIPSQTSTKDSCDMDDDDSELWEKLRDLGMISIGWIHTHPTQTAFMSSVDLHTHIGYQSLLDEAIALVLAPTDQQQRLGIFRLTEQGMSEVGACERQGFHEHSAGLFEACKHVQIDAGLQAEVYDLRKK